MSEAESTSATRIAMCRPADRPEQARLYDLCFGKQDGLAVLPWRYDQNPHGEAVTFVARGPGGEPVSGYACSPRRALARGAPDSAAILGQTGDVMTHPDWRGRGVFSGLDRAAMAETRRRGWPVVFGLPNRRSEKIFTEKLGWRAVGRLRPWTFVLASDEGARAERLRAGRAAALAVPWAYWRGTLARGRLRDRAFERVDTLAIRRFGEEVDAVAAEVARRFPLMVQRDQRFLNWRFIEAPSGLFRAHGVYEPSGRMCGYAVVQLPRPGAGVGYLVDALGRDEVALAAALDAALGHLAKAAASVARAWAVEGSFWERELRRAGFRAGKRDDAKAIIVQIHRPEHPLARAALDPASWYFTDGDRDDETVS